MHTDLKLSSVKKCLQSVLGARGHHSSQHKSSQPGRESGVLQGTVNNIIE